MESEQFAAHARLEGRHWWFTARREILRALLHAVAPPHRGIAVLDLGCGTGGNAGALASEYRVLGLDPSAAAIAFAQARFPRVPFVRTADPEAGRSHLEQGGALLMTDVLEHVAGDQALFDSAVAVVPAGGHLILTVPADPALWSHHDVEFGHFRRYGEPDFRALWRDSPVEERLLSPYNARLRPVVSAIRKIAGHRGSDLRIPAGPMNGVLRRIFAGEAPALCRAVDSGTRPFARGVSLIAVLRKL